MHRKTIFAALMLWAFLFSGCTRPHSGAVDLDASAAYQLTQEKRGDANFAILDVRTPGEYAAGHIPGAVNADFHSPSFRTRLSRLDKGRAWLVYCRSGNRSGKTLPELTALGFPKLYHLKDGIRAWAAAGLPLER